nr:immunoglobulin light chain junction region [Macaca mulatta]
DYFCSVWDSTLSILF